MSDAPLAPRAPAPLARRNGAASAAEVRADLARARARAVAQLEALQERLGPAGHWRDTVRRHPVLTLGGALLLGYLAGRLFDRR